MPNPSNSPRQVRTSWQEPAFPAFTALCDEALRRCSTQHGLPVSPSAELRLWAWRLCWLALDAASAPANNLPDLADAQAWPPQLVEQLRAAPALPKLNTQTWQELRRARDQQLFAALPVQEAAAEAVANEALAALLTEVLAQLGLGQLRAWITPSTTAAMTQWLSACLLAIDALALSDDNTDATALELVVFVQVTLKRVHGSVAVADDLVQREPEQPAVVSDSRVLEAVRGAEPAAALEPQPVASLAATPAALRPDASDVAADPSGAQSADAIDQPPSTSTVDYSHVNAPHTLRRLRSRAIVQVASMAAVGAGLLFMLKTGDVAPPPAATQATNQAKPPVTPPELPVVAPAPNAPVPELANTPAPSIKPPTGTAPRRPRYRNLAAAKRAHAAKKIDDAAYAAAIAELEALRAAKIAKEQLELSRGKRSQSEYQRRVDAINSSLGFERH
jgi:hypothetical protein